MTMLLLLLHQQPLQVPILVLVRLVLWVYLEANLTAFLANCETNSNKRTVLLANQLQCQVLCLAVPILVRQQHLLLPQLLPLAGLLYQLWSLEVPVHPPIKQINLFLLDRLLLQ
jgi:hypothetical protein